MPGYRHTQVGWQVYGVAIPLTLGLLYILRLQDAQVFVVVIAIFAATFALFGWLTVRVDTRGLLIKFGIGLIRRRMPLDTIRGFAAVTNPWYYGWGIRFTPHGMLYNVSGFQAVELLLGGGRRVRVGTDEPEALVRALQNATGVSASNTIDEFPKDVGWRRRRRAIAAAIVAVTVALIFGQVYLHSAPPSVHLTAETFSARSGFYGVDIPLSSIQRVELIDTLPSIQRRTSGYAARGILRGNFRLEQWGSGKLFVNRNAPPFVSLRTPDTYVVINFDEAVRTRELYAQLAAAIGHPPRRR